MQDLVYQRRKPYERDTRAPDAPPVDGLAECVVLNRCIYEPSLIDAYDLDGMLAFPEHREIWRVIKLTRAHYRGDDAGFLVAFWQDLQTAHPDKWVLYDDLLSSVADRESFRAWQEYCLGDGGQPYSTFLHEHRWWYERVRAIAEARAALSVLQAEAERLWRVPERPYPVSKSLTNIHRGLGSITDEVIRIPD